MASLVAKKLLSKASLLNSIGESANIIGESANIANAASPLQSIAENIHKHTEQMETMTWVVRLLLNLMYAKFLIPFFIVFYLLTYLYVVFFQKNKYRVRYPNSSIMISLDPELTAYAEKIADFITIYTQLLKQSNNLNYDLNITSNLFFFKNNRNITTSLNGIITLMESVDIRYSEKKDEDIFKEDIVKFILSNFRFTKSEKFPFTNENQKKQLLDSFFAHITKLKDEERVFNSFIEDKSILNFLDMENMSFESLLNNKLFTKYGKFLPNGDISEYTKRILENSNHKNTNISTLQLIIDENESIFMKSELDISLDNYVLNLFDNIINMFNFTIFNYFFKDVDIEEEDSDDMFNDVKGCSIKHISKSTIYNKLHNSDISELFVDNIDKQNEFRQLIEALKSIQNMKTFWIDNKDDGDALLSYFNRNYIFIEKLLFETFHSEDFTNIFVEPTASDILASYQTIIDCIYVKTHSQYIEMATIFTINYVLDDNTYKDEQLENIANFYLLFNDLVILEKHSRKKLEKYAEYRNPDPSKLKKMYSDWLKSYIDFFLTGGIKNQWSALFEGKVPPRYYWTLMWIRKSTPSIKDLLKWIFSDVALSNDQENSGRDGTEDFVEKFIPDFNTSIFYSEPNLNENVKKIFTTFSSTEKIAILNYTLYLSEQEKQQLFTSLKTFFVLPKHEQYKIINSFDSKLNMIKLWTTEAPSVTEEFDIPGIGPIVDFVKKITGIAIKVFKSTFTVLKNVVKLVVSPIKLISFFVKLILAGYLVLFKLTMYLKKVKAGKDGVYILGEFILYCLVLYAFTLYNLAWWAIMTVYTTVSMFLDLTIFKGKLYSFLYWLLGATENGPRAWYMKEGFHFGQHMCKADKCDMYYRNKNNRMFFSYHACGNNFKPSQQHKGFMCSKLHPGEPGYCLQANINRIRENEPTSYFANIVPGKFMPDLEYLESSKSNRRKIAKNFKKMKQNFWNNCENTMEDYDPLAKNICRLYPEVIKEKYFDQTRKMCYNTYCSNGNREPFCYKFTKNTNSMMNPDTQNTNIMNSLFVSTIYIIVLSVLCNNLMSQAFVKS